MLSKFTIILLTGLPAAYAFSLNANSKSIAVCRKFGVISPVPSRYSTSLYSEEVDVAETASTTEGEFWEDSADTDREFIDLYIGNLDWDIDEDFLADEFSVYGEVSNVFLPRDRDTGRKRGFAFVTMVGREGAERAVEGLDGEQLYGRNVRVNEAQKREPRTTRPRPVADEIDPSTFNQSGGAEVKLYIGNLNYETPVETVRKAFEDIGSVSDVYFPLDRDTGSPRGFCFVTMPADDALSAATALNGSAIDGRTIRVSESRPKPQN